MQKSTSANGRRIAAAVFLGAASTAMVAGTAHADGVTKAKVHDGYRDAGHVDMNDDPGANTALIGLDVPGSSDPLWTYCIQQTVELNTDETYDEHAWSDAADRTHIDPQHLEAVKWILNNSYPQISDLRQLAQDNQVQGSLTSVEAVEATQAAIWTFADTSGHTKLSSDEGDTQVVALYDSLVKAAKGHMSDTDQPKASLTISTASTTAQAGSKVAFTLSSNTPGSFISVALSDPQKTGAKLVNTKGSAIAPNARLAKGDVVYVQLPSSVPKGSITLTATGTVSGLEAGRVFLSHDGRASQNLILAQSQSTPVSASTELKWAPTVVTSTTPSSSPSTAPSTHPSTTTPSTVTSSTPSGTPSSPTGGLAHTGAGNTVPLAGGALALVAAGGGMMLYTRRSRKQGSHS